MLVDLREVSFGYRRKVVLSDVSLALHAGESVAVVGPSGSGKSTLASIVATLVRPHGGTALICGHDVSRLSRRSLAELRRRSLGMVFQGAELLPTMTAVENVALPAMLDGCSWTEASARAVALLGDLGVGQVDTPAATLSGGEAQRVGLARALVNGPDLLVADEPTASLDGHTKRVVADLLFDQIRERRTGLLLVSHDPEIARRADRVLRLDDGTLTAAAPHQGRPECA
ncbi:MAG TPA: ABC transporter ATP-binding protein [Actinotalea sp.]|jgi:predicted ABC-type transport system involved in lysophospholipase L1 biosynthesis ATPase subunit